MKENFRATHYNNGTAIPKVTSDSEWIALTKGARSWYSNFAFTFADVYGSLYNWYVINSGEICPFGWHVPTDGEWKELESYLGVSQSELNISGWRGDREGGKMKDFETIYWLKPNTGATNSSRFDALPGGYRDWSDGQFQNASQQGMWWSATSSPPNNAWYRGLDYARSSIYRGTNHRNSGYSIRCIKDISTTGAAPTLFIDSIIIYSMNPTVVVANVNITNDGGSSVTSKGVWWSLTPFPTSSDNYTDDGSGTGTFNSVLTNLIADTVYYIRAYATNSFGTGYTSQMQFNTLPPITGDPCPGMPFMHDYDLNIYNTVQIGNQCWMKENLRVTHYNDGTPIQTDQTAWNSHTTGAMGWYNDDSATYADPYGALYNWIAVDNGNLCPPGWHVPSRTEWDELIDYVGLPSTAGGELKDTGTVYWSYPNTGATNSVNFSALPGGTRTSGGGYDYIGNQGRWWTATQSAPLESYFFRMFHNSNSASFWSWGKSGGASVRCIRD